uniref:Uncharacterized protein n=1 Tax=Anopheles atroparvus TaxID=41427 RepID=A0AAG5DVP6_ANOAO
VSRFSLNVQIGTYRLLYILSLTIYGSSVSDGWSDPLSLELYWHWVHRLRNSLESLRNTPSAVHGANTPQALLVAPLKILRHQHEVAGGRIPLTVDVATVADRLEQNAGPAPPDEDRLEEEGIVGRPARHEMDKVVAVRPQIFTGGTVLDVVVCSWARY